MECGPPELPENGEVATPDGTSYGAKARYSCKMRFELQGSEFRTCQRNGEWSPKAPFCKRRRLYSVLVIAEHHNVTPLLFEVIANVCVYSTSAYPAPTLQTYFK